MKTPHRITLIRGASTVYDPITDEYVTTTGEEVTLPCFANHISQAKVFELYGNRTDKVMIARFMQPQEKFDKAIFNGGTYAPIEQTDAPKMAYRLKWVSE